MRKLKLFLNAKAANTPPRGINKASRVIFLVLTLLLLSIGQMWGATADVTFTPGTDTGATSVTKSGVTCTMTTMNNASYYQIYAGQSGTFEVSSGNITKIEFTCTANGTSKYGPGNASANVGSYSYSGTKGTWTGEASSVTISSTAQIRMTALTITVSTGSSEKTLSVDPTIIDFGTVEQNAVVASQTVEVSFANLTGSVAYSGLSSPFTASGTISSTGDEITIAANTANVGNYSQTLTVQSTADSKSAEVTVKMNVVEPFDGLKLTFDVSSNPGEWPTTNSTTTTDYTYTLNEVDYTFALNNVKCNSGYLMLYYVAKLGLPAISGYKLVKVEATNSSGCSTSTKVKVSSDENDENVVSGGSEQTWATQSSTYTYTLTGTEENTMYYLYVTNKNCQIVELVLYYEETEAAAVAQPSISGETPFLTSTTVTINKAEGTTVYYTTDGSDPKTSSTKQTYSAAFNLNASATVKAIATDGANWSEPVEKAFVKATVLSVALARAAIDAGGDLSNKFVAGIISQIDSYNSTYNSITYWISDDGTTTNQLQVYSGLAGVVKSAFASKDDLAVGDDVTVKGTLKKYGSTYEFDYNNTIEAYKPIARLAWSAESYDASLEGGNTFPTLTNTNGVTVSYSSSDPAKAEIADEKVYDITLNDVGSTTITASFDGNETYKANSASYTLNIASSLVTLTYNVDGGEAIDPVNVSALPNPLPTTTKAGYNFGGWFTDSEKTVEAVPGTAISQNTTLFAKWLDPYTVAEAKTVIDANPDGIANQYVAGIISQIDSYNNTYKSITYWISADGTTTNQLQVYSGKIGNAATALGKEEFSAKEDLKLGDEVVVVGTLKLHNSSVYEFDKNNTIYSFSRPVVQTYSITYEENGANEDIDDDDAATNLPNPLPTVTKSGKVFGGWWTTSDFQVGTLAVAGAQLSDDVILYAKWEDLSVWATTYTSNVTLSTEGGTSASAAKVKFYGEEGDGYDAIKAGTGSAQGAVVVNVPAGATALHFHTYSWYNETVELTVTAPTGVTVTPSEAIAINKNSGISGSSSTYTLAEGSDPKTDAYYAVSLSGNTEPVALTISATSGKRFVLFGVNQEGGIVPELQSIEIAGDLTAKSYKAGDALDLDGLTVNAIYSLGGTPQTPVDITDDAELEWSYAPLVENQTSITITATYNGQTDDITINDLVVTSADPKIYVSTLNVNFASVEVGESVPAAKTVTVTLTNVASVTATLGGTNADAFSVSPASLTESGDITISLLASTDAAASYSATLTISDGEGGADDKTINLSFAVTEPVTPEDPEVRKTWDLSIASYDANPTEEQVTWSATYVNMVADKANSTTAANNYLGGDVNNRTSSRFYKNSTLTITPNAKEITSVVFTATSTSYANALQGSEWTNASASVDGTTVTVTPTDGKNAIIAVVGGTCGFTAVQVNYKNIAPEPPVVDYTEVRNGLTEGWYYTMCLDKAVTAVKAGSIWRVLSKAANGNDVILEEVTGTLDAGRPYIFRAAASTLEVAYTGDAVLAPVTEGNNGLVGSFTEEPLAQNSNHYIIYNNALYYVNSDNVKVGAHRAYLDMTSVPAYNSGSAPAPGRRRITMEVHGEQVATGIDAINASEKPMKLMIDGQIYILRGEKMYDATGRLVK